MGLLKASIYCDMVLYVKLLNIETETWVLLRSTEVQEKRSRKTTLFATKMWSIKTDDLW